MVENEPAFPTKVKRSPMSDPLATPREVEFPGMTLRDWFAGQALSVCVKGVDRPYSEWADHAYSLADEMMEARK